VVREEISLNLYLAHRAAAKRKRKVEGFKGASLRSTVNGFAKEFLDLINSGTFEVRRDKCEEIQPFMGPRRIEYATDDEEDPFGNLTKIAKSNGFRHPKPKIPQSMSE
jgi:hypothetical protein